MKPLIQKMTNALEARFPGVEVDLSVRKLSHKVGGFVIWDGFLGQQQFERQQQLRNVLKQALTVDELSKLTFIITATSKEVESVNEPVVA